VRLRSGEQIDSQSFASFKRTATTAIADKIKDLSY